MALDPRLASIEFLTLAALRLKLRQSPEPQILVIYRDDDESSQAAIRRTLGRTAHPWETVLVVEYAPESNVQY